MDEADLSELPIEKEYSENINRQMQVPQSIKLMSSDGISRNHIPDSVYDSMRLPGKIVAFSTDDAGFHDDLDIAAKGDGIEMSPPPRKIRANNPAPGDVPDIIPTISSKYPQSRKADTQRRLFDSNEESILNDLDETTENEKLRKQIFKLNRRLTTLEKRNREEREMFKVCALVISCGIVASCVMSIVNR